MPLAPTSAIFVAEYKNMDFYNNQLRQWYHCFLCLFDTTKSPEPRPERLIESFDCTWRNGQMFATRSKNMTLGLFKDTYFSLIPDSQDYAERVLTHWRVMTGEAEKELKNGSSVLFGHDFREDPTAINCRTGVRDTLALGGTTLQRGWTRNAAGLNAERIFPSLSPQRLILP